MSSPSASLANALGAWDTLRNRYFLLRHGQSEANVAGLIVSGVEGTKKYGLTATGRQQVEHTIATSIQCGLLSHDTVIYSSDFVRALETAEIAAALLRTQEKVHVAFALRERYFGQYDETSNDNYNKVWDRDRSDANNTTEGVESVNSVLERSTRLVVELEGAYEDRTILLVAHGDTLQILQTGFLKVDPAGHRSVEHLTTAELRAVSIAATKT
jgi:broad specificity phosphatase PhoE